MHANEGPEGDYVLKLILYEEQINYYLEYICC